VYSAEVASASEETTSEEAASEEAAAEDAVEDAVEDAAVEAEPPQAVMPTASARAAAAIATVLSFIGIISFFFFCWCQAYGSIPTALVGLMFSYYTHIDKKSKLFSLKTNDKTRTVTILT
jgi:hypothetical protein